MPKKYFLQSLESHDYLIIGLVTNLAGYRLCYYLNAIFRLRLARIEDMPAYGVGIEQSAYFQLYACSDPLRQTEWYVLANKTTDRFLVPSLRQIDYFMLLDGLPYNINLGQITAVVGKLQQIQFASQLNPAGKSELESMLMDFEVHLSDLTRKQKEELTKEFGSLKIV